MKKQPIRISKLRGLQKIEIYGLPHPNWRFVDAQSNVEDLLKHKPKYGWTIRSCSTAKGLEIKLPFANNVPKTRMKKMISRFAKELHDDAVFAIYPSWVFKKSGTCFLTASHIVIETIAGPIAPLTDGKIMPTLHLVLNRFDNKIEKTIGEKDFLVQKELQTLLHYCRKIAENNVVLEWAITNEDRLYFFHWLET